MCLIAYPSLYMCLHPKYDDQIDRIENDPKMNLSNVFSDEQNLTTESCSYYETSDLDSLHADNYKMKVLHLNIRSLQKHNDNLRNLLELLKDSQCEIDVVLICESHITPKNNLENCKIPGYTLYEKHRTLRDGGGGIAIFVNSKLKFTKRDDLCIFDEYEFESLFIEVKLGNKRSVIIGEVYRVPNTDIGNFFQKYQSIVDNVI